MNNRTYQPLFSQSTPYEKLPPPDEKGSVITGIIALVACLLAFLLFWVPLYPLFLAGAGIFLGKSRLKRLKKQCDQEDLQSIVGQMMACRIMERGKVAEVAIHFGWFVLFISVLATIVQLSIISSYQNPKTVQNTKIIQRD